MGDELKFIVDRLNEAPFSQQLSLVRVSDSFCLPCRAITCDETQSSSGFNTDDETR